MRSLKLGRFGAARIWLNEGAGASYAVSRVLADTAASGRVGESLGSRSAAAEVVLPRGARSEYGLLGGSFSPQRSSSVALSVAVSNGSEPLRSSIARAVDDVRIGLPEEYAKAVLQAARVAASALPTGSLTFNEGAHGAVGSSPLFFGMLARFVIKLLLVPNDVSDDAIVTLFQALGGP
jgi:hypothetical protein